MKIDEDNNQFIYVFLFSIICFFLFIQVGLFEYIIPNFIKSDYSDIGLISGDAIIHHHSSSYFAELLKIKEYKLFFYDFLDFTSIPLNIKILSFFYAYIKMDPIVTIVLNFLLFLLSIFLLFKICNVVIQSRKNSKVLFFISSLLILFFPSYIYVFNSSGKESFIIPLLLIFFYFFINICKQEKYHFSKLDIILFFLSFSLMHSLKPHFSYMLFVSCCLFLFFYLINLKDNKNQIFNFIILLSIMLLIYFIFSFLLEDFLKNFNHTEAKTINKYIGDVVAGRYGSDNENYIITFEHNRFIPDFIENKYFEILSLRNHFINYSALVGSETIIGKDIYPNSIIKFLLYCPELIFNSVLTPFPNSYFENSSIFLVIANVEMIFIYLIFFGLLINLLNLETYEFFLILMCLFVCSVLLFVNPNLGTHYRVRLPFMLILSILGIKSWLHIFFSLYKKNLDKNSFTKINLQNISLFKFIQNSYQNLFFLITFVILVLFREVILINVIGINDNLSLYLITISLLGIFANSLNLPLNDTLITHRNVNSQSLSSDSYKLISSILILLILFLAIFFAYSENLPSFFQLNSELNFAYYLVVTSIIISIPVNALSSSHLFILKKNKISYLLQNIIPVSSLIIIYFYRDNISLDLIYYSISFGVMINTISLILISLNNGMKFNFFSNLKLDFLLFNNPQFFNLLKITLSFLLTNSYIVIIIYISSRSSSDQFPIINIGLRFLLLINAIIASIISAMILPLFKKNNVLNEYSIKIILILFVIICTTVSFCSLIIENFGVYLSFEEYKILICILKILPLSIMLGLILKYFIHVYKLNIFLITGIFYSIIYLILLTMGNIKSIFEMVNILSFIFLIQMITLLFFLKFSFRSNLYFFLILLMLIIFNYLEFTSFLVAIFCSFFIVFLYIKIKNHFNI